MRKGKVVPGEVGLGVIGTVPRNALGVTLLGQYEALLVGPNTAEHLPHYIRVRLAVFVVGLELCLRMARQLAAKVIAPQRPTQPKDGGPDIIVSVQPQQHRRPNQLDAGRRVVSGGHEVEHTAAMKVAAEASGGGRRGFAKGSVAGMQGCGAKSRHQDSPTLRRTISIFSRPFATRS